MYVFDNFHSTYMTDADRKAENNEIIYILYMYTYIFSESEANFIIFCFSDQCIHILFHLILNYLFIFCFSDSICIYIIIYIYIYIYIYMY